MTTITSHKRAEVLQHYRINVLVKLIFSIRPDADRLIQTRYGDSRAAQRSHVSIKNAISKLVVFAKQPSICNPVVKRKSVKSCLTHVAQVEVIRNYLCYRMTNALFYVNSPAASSHPQQRLKVPKRVIHLSDSRCTVSGILDKDSDILLDLVLEPQPTVFPGTREIS